MNRRSFISLRFWLLFVLCESVIYTLYRKWLSVSVMYIMHWPDISLKKIIYSNIWSMLQFYFYLLVLSPHMNFRLKFKILTVWTYKILNFKESGRKTKHIIQIQQYIITHFFNISFLFFSSTFFHRPPPPPCWCMLYGYIYDETIRPTDRSIDRQTVD